MIRTPIPVSRANRSPTRWTRWSSAAGSVAWWPGLGFAAMIEQAEARQTGYIEPSAEAEECWVGFVRRTSRPNPVLAECTPGYYNNEGQSVASRDGYSGTAVEFHELLRKWRAGNGFVDVLGHEAK
jgi:hypothetical protein